MSAFGNNDFKNTTWGDYVLQHPEEDVYLEGPPRKAATYKAKTSAARRSPPRPRMVIEPLPENVLNNLNIRRRENDEADLLRSGLTLQNIYAPPRRRSPSPRRRSPSPRRRAPSPRRRSPSPPRRRASPPRRRSPSVNEFGRNLTRNYRRRAPVPTRRNVSPLRYMRASNGRLINEFGRNVPRGSPPRAPRGPRFYNERSRTYRLPTRYYDDATGRYS